jgi:MFS family permease
MSVSLPLPLFRNRNYLLHWSASAISCLGDYFTLIAMPWLVLSLSHGAAVLGVVMALESLPRAVFMLVSGGVSDRYTPLAVLLASRAAFMVALVALALLLWSGHLEVVHLYGFALLFGVLSAFSMPAASALLPRLVDREQLQKGNSTLMGARQMIQLFAPVLAGLLIWGMPSSGLSDAHVPASASDLSRIGWAFVFNAAAVLVSLIMMFRIRLAPLDEGGRSGAGNIPGKIRLADGFRYVWQDQGLRIVTLYAACIGFFAIGPLLTVIPQFAAQRLDQGAFSYGLLYAANGLGALAGFTCAGLLRKPDARTVGLVLFTADLVAGVCLLWFAQSGSFGTAASALAVMGVANAYGGVVAMSWIQQRIPMRLSGRVLGVVMFAMMGLAPVSMALSGGVIAQYSLSTLLWVSGSVVAGFSLLGLVLPGLNRFGTYPSPPSPQAA